MIYFDNAATTKDKPVEVYEAVSYYLKEVGVSPGRGSYSMGITASRMLYKARTGLGRYFGLSEPDKVIFTKNSTEAMNLFFNGFLKKGDHVLISCYEHNAVLRPLQSLKEKNFIDYSIISKEDLSLSPEQIYNKYVQDNTRLLAITLASNLTGRIVWNREITKFFQSKSVVTFVDSSQGAGKIDISMADDGIDYLAFTGHKDLLGIPGIGGLCCQGTYKLTPLLQGGTGIHGEDYVNPDVFPEGYEAGTLNMPGIWALYTGVQFINKNKTEIRCTEKSLLKYLLGKLNQNEDIIVYEPEVERVSTCCINHKKLTSDKLVALLDQHGICTRGGIHCAILAHEALETVNTGAVRISLSYNNTKTEVDELVRVLENIGE